MVIAIILVSTTSVAAKPVFEDALSFVKESKGVSDDIKDVSLALMALVSTEGKTVEDLSGYIDDYTGFLLDSQNPDGGWGRTKGQASDVISTSYAVIALSYTLSHYPSGSEMYQPVESAADSGVDYLVGAFNGEAWGYVPGTASAFYPSVMAIWALGSMGYRYEGSYVVPSGVEYVEGVDSYGGFPDYMVEGLKLMAYHAVGYIPSDLDERLGEIKGLLLGGELKPSERAFLTYLVVLYEDINFDTAKILVSLEDARHTDPTYWADEPTFLNSDTKIVEASAYATLALSVGADKISETQENPFRSSCEMLRSLQNEDGGWSYAQGFPSNEKATYYALRALKLCYFRDPSIERGIEWMKGRLPVDAAYSKELGQIYPPHIYTILALAEFGELSEEEKTEQIELIKSLKRKDGEWGSFLGPQPLDTALAIKALLALGVSPDDPDVKAAKNWLLSISNGGWGTYVRTKYYSSMLSSNVPTTLEVLEALLPISTKNELEGHVQWLLAQRLEDGSWPMIKENVFHGVVLYEGVKSLEMTIRVTQLLKEFGYNFDDDTLKLVEESRKESVPDLALSTIYLSNFKFIPKTNLYDVTRLLGEEKFTVVYTDGRKTDAEAVSADLLRYFDANASVEAFDSFEDGNYIVLADYSDFNLDDYNPYLSVSIENGMLNVEGRAYYTENSILLIPGKYENGYVLFVLYEPATSSAVRTLFDSGLIKYLKGDAIVVQFHDNGDGVAEVRELTADIVG